MGGAPSAVEELPRSFLRDWVAAVRGVGIPGQKEPGQAEACPHTAAITRNCKRKKTPAEVIWALLRLLLIGFLRPVAEFAATGEPYRRALLLARELIDRLSSNMSMAIMGASPLDRSAASVVPSNGRRARTRLACRSASEPAGDHCCWLPSCEPPTCGRRAHTVPRGTP